MNAKTAPMSVALGSPNAGTSSIALGYPNHYKFGLKATTAKEDTGLGYGKIAIEAASQQRDVKRNLQLEQGISTHFSSANDRRNSRNGSSCESRLCSE